jgi:hypothetical protein
MLIVVLMMMLRRRSRLAAGAFPWKRYRARTLFLVARGRAGARASLDGSQEHPGEFALGPLSSLVMDTDIDEFSCTSLILGADLWRLLSILLLTDGVQR